MEITSRYGGGGVGGRGFSEESRNPRPKLVEDENKRNVCFWMKNKVFIIKLINKTQKIAGNEIRHICVFGLSSPHSQSLPPLLLLLLRGRERDWSVSTFNFQASIILLKIGPNFSQKKGPNLFNQLNRLIKLKNWNLTPIKKNTHTPLNFYID